MVTANTIKSLCASVRGARNTGATELAAKRTHELALAVASGEKTCARLEKSAETAWYSGSQREGMFFSQQARLREAIAEAKELLGM